MPLTITRPTKPPESVGSQLSDKSDQLCQQMAEVAQRALQSTTPNRWKKFLYAAVSTMAVIPDGYGVGGPIGTLLPEKRPAERNTIANFLKDHKEFYTGKKPPKNLAWWFLSDEGKEKLKEERMAGRYGGAPPTAPYWLIAEFGSRSSASSVDTGVPAIQYIAKSREIVEQQEATVRQRIMAGL